MYPSMKEPSRRCTYTCTILDGGDIPIVSGGREGGRVGGGREGRMNGGRERVCTTRNSLRVTILYIDIHMYTLCIVKCSWKQSAI